MVQRSLPWFRVTGATIRPARERAIIASVSVTAGATGVTTSGIVIVDGASGASSASEIDATMASSSTSLPQCAGVSTKASGVVVTTAAVGARSIFAAIVARLAARTSRSIATRGATVTLFRAVRASSTTRSTGLPVRPTAKAWSSIVSTSARRPSWA